LPAGQFYKFQNWFVGIRALFAAAAVVAAVCCLASITSTSQAVRANHNELWQHKRKLSSAGQRNRLVSRPKPPKLARASAPYASDMNVAVQALAGNNLGRAKDC